MVTPAFYANSVYDSPRFAIANPSRFYSTFYFIRSTLVNTLRRDGKTHTATLATRDRQDIL